MRFLTYSVSDPHQEDADLNPKHCNLFITNEAPHNFFSYHFWKNLLDARQRQICRVIHPNLNAVGLGLFYDDLHFARQFRCYTQQL